MRYFNYLTIDLESWMFTGQYLKIDWKKRKEIDNGYVLRSTEKILEILDKFDTKLTFFVLGELYEWYPELIHRIFEKGHEIAYHTHSHELINGKKSLEESFKQSREFLQEFHPLGFRAPNVHLPEIAISILNNNNFIYDSSVYGLFSQNVRGIIEIPVFSYPIFRRKRVSNISFPGHLTLRRVLTEIPIGSGYFLAILGKKVSYFIKKINEEGHPAVLFLHNWQIVKPEDAKLPKGMMNKLLEVPYTFEKLDLFIYLLKNFKIRPINKGIAAGDFC